MAAVCYNLKRLLKWRGEKGKNTQKMLALLVFELSCILVQECSKSRLDRTVSK
jgi:hypothetical protein